MRKERCAAARWTGHLTLHPLQQHRINMADNQGWHVCMHARTGQPVDAIDHWAQQVRSLEAAIEAERARCLGSEPSPAFFAFFRTQKDAAFAAQTRLHPEDGHSFRVMEAPGPDEVLLLFRRSPMRMRCMHAAHFPLCCILCTCMPVAYTR